MSIIVNVKLKSRKNQLQFKACLDNMYFSSTAYYFFAIFFAIKVIIIALKIVLNKFIEMCPVNKTSVIISNTNIEINSIQVSYIYRILIPMCRRSHITNFIWRPVIIIVMSTELIRTVIS